MLNRPFALILSFLIWAIPLFADASISQPTYGVIERLEVMVPLSDGIKLATNIFLPDGEGPWPTILVRTPYDKGESGNESGHFFAERGYAYVVQDVRGRFDSEGVFVPLLTEAEDGYQVQSWVAAQSWCNGHIGTAGGSYVGMTQWLPAPRRHPALKAMFTEVTTANVYEAWYRNGVLKLGLAAGWSIWVTDPPGFDAAVRDSDQLFRFLPLATLDLSATGRTIPFFRDWLRHPTPDGYWAPAIVDDEYDQIDVPVFNVGGWYDIFADETVANYVGMVREGKTQVIRDGQRLLMGPWVHNIWGASSGKVGEMDFGQHAGIDWLRLLDLQLRWFDYALKGLDNGVRDEAPVRIFVMGENQWRDEDEWPLERTQPTPYFLHSVGGANSRSGDGLLAKVQMDSSRIDTFAYNPANPVPSLEGGPDDQGEIEDREDVLVFSTDVLEAPGEVTGRVSLILFAASSAPNTDFTAKLVDVHPMGYAQDLCHGIVRASRRVSNTDLSFINPGQVYRYEIDLGVTSNLFHAGHRIRLEVASSDFPYFDRNLNTGKPFGQDAEMAIAHQAVYHDKEYPSQLILPIIPR